MKRTLLFVFVLLVAATASAVQRSAAEALEVARTFFSQNVLTRSDAEVRLAASSVDLLPATRLAGSEPAFYVFNRGTDAFVIVSGDDRMKDVLAYSDGGAFVTKDLPANMLGWLELCQSHYAALAAGQAAPAASPAVTRVTTRSFPAEVAPMLTVSWNQDAPYNNDCPLIKTSANKEERAVTGCVATAMAMIMKYYNYPETCKNGTHSVSVTHYDNSTTTASFVFTNAKFDWDNMIANYETASYTDEQASAVAKLMYACGIAVDMKYGASSSGGSAASSLTMAQAFIDYFGYNANMGYVMRDYFTSDEWMDMLKEELSNNRPVLYDGSSLEGGHEFVFDGYDKQNLVHVNWGWGGYNNGYYEIETLQPSSMGIGGGSGQGGGFARGQGMLLGLHPDSSTSAYQSFWAVDYLTAVGLDLNDASSTVSVQKGGKWQFGYTWLINYGTDFQTGEIALLAEKDGKRQEITSLGVLKQTVKSGYGFVGDTVSVTMPSTLTDGEYLLYLATKEKREAEWSRVRGVAGYTYGLTMKVAGSQCTLSSFSGGLDVNGIEGTVAPKHNLYSGVAAGFALTMTNKNTDAEFYGEVGVALATKADAPQFVSFVGQIPVTVKPGETREFTVTGNLTTNLLEAEKNLPAGEYYILPAFAYGSSIYSMEIDASTVVATVSAAVAGADIKVDNARLQNTALGLNDNLCILADISLDPGKLGIGNVYNKTLMAAVFENNTSTTSNLHYINIFVEKDTPYSVVMEFNPMVGEGTHTVQLHKPNSSGDYDGSTASFIAKFNFTVSSTVTGIEDEVADVKGFVISEQPVTDVLRFRCADEVKRMTIYNLSGQTMWQGELNGAAGRENSISISTLAAGYYVVSAQTTDGKVYRTKFIKK